MNVQSRPFHTKIMQKLADALLDQHFTEKKVDVDAEVLWSKADKD